MALFLSDFGASIWAADGEALFNASVNWTVNGGTNTCGSLSITNPAVADFLGVTLNGTAQFPTANLAVFTVEDTRGTGAGLRVTAQGTEFREYADGAYVTGGKMLPTSSLMMSQPSVTAVGTTSPNPTVMAGTCTIDGAAVTIASAATNTGMGRYDFSATTLTLTIPPSVYA